jgi:hypothetical protein
MTSSNRSKFENQSSKISWAPTAPTAKSTLYTVDLTTFRSGVNSVTKANISPQLDVASDAPMLKSQNHEHERQHLHPSPLILQFPRREAEDDRLSAVAEEDGPTQSQQKTQRIDL